MMALFQSNIVQLAMTAGLGSVLFLLAQRVSWLVAAIGYILSAGIIPSALFVAGTVTCRAKKRDYFVAKYALRQFQAEIFIWQGNIGEICVSTTSGSRSASLGFIV